MDLSDLLTHDVEISSAARWVLAAWTFVFGAAVGSFMNVVVYRLPRRMSLSRPGSRCPTCGHAIRWYDNVPIFGWLLLRGRCRDCRSAISARYPIVELCVALVCSALVFFVTRIAAQGSGDTELLYTFSAGRYVLQALLACTLISAALIEYDGQQAPPSMMLTMLVMAIAVAAVAGGSMPTREPELEPFGDLARSVLGAVTGLWFALLGWPAYVSDGRSPRVALGLSRAGELVLVGACLGASAVTVIAPAAMLLVLILRATVGRAERAGYLDYSASILFCALMAITVGRWLLDEPLYGTLESRAVVCGVAVAIASLVAWVQVRGRRVAER